jgi:predicted phage terminase large subunit-like protein
MSELNFSLLNWQQEVFKDETRFKVVAAGRRCGKSRLSAITLLIEALNCPVGSAVMYIAPTLGMARTIMYDLLLDLGKPVIKSAHVNNLEITLVNGRKIMLRGADNPDSLRGVSLTYVVLDECAFIKEDTWQKIIRAALSDKKGRALFISTPSGRNWFYDLFNLGKEGDDEEWKSWHKTTADNETIDPKEIEAAKRTLSSFAFKQEYLSSFDTTGADVFKHEWIKRDVEPKNGSYVVAIDLAGFQDISAGSTNKSRLDETAIAIVKIKDDGSWWIKDIMHGRWDIKETCNKILEVIKEYRPVGIGIEKGTAKNAALSILQDMMRQRNVYAHITSLTHGNKKKTDRVIWALQGKFEHGRITLNQDADLETFVDQLVMFPTKGVHDDLVDALAYVEQLALNSFVPDYEEDEYEVYDVVSGY